MSNLVQFPGTPSDRALNDDSDRPHAEAFRDIESEVGDLDRMGEIATDLIMHCSATEDSSHNLELATFAVWQMSKMLKEFRKNYHKRYQGEEIAS
ncbi:hypothetical protein FXV83_15270 [Bradyrhizobium hipponense]|uniref:Uncharacterized protein n=1 Tax=Bradyrhizobium hipponense TaxID=2605638 RepID=A0A5S4YPJ8_9BRAD|nr:hypothetical protein [Bradyrhizobium hipponense]TYO65594.1 hypothetical protein FXV83_15270 [Bradyrhizobium hipponense]